MLAPFGTPGTEQQYLALINEWLANDRSLPVAADQLTITELVVAYFTYVTGRYRRPDGTPTSTVHNTRAALRQLS